MVLPNSNDRGAESESVRQILKSMICEAEAQAKMVAAYLRDNGIKPCRQEKSSTVPTNPPTGPVSNFLLELGAALRLQTWEQAQIIPQLQTKFPPAAQALAESAHHLVTDSRESQRPPELSQTMFRTSYRRLSRAAQAELGVSVALPSTWNHEHFLDRLADFLWEHRHLSETLKEKDRS